MKQAKKQQTEQAIQDEDTQISGNEDVEFVYNEIDKLEQFGINSGDIGKLKSAGLCTVLSVLMW